MKNKKIYTIYRFFNKATKKSYIGVTGQKLEIRVTRHEQNATKRQNPTSIFYKAIRKYGIKNFELVIINTYSSKTKALKAERYYIKKLKTKSPMGYNLTEGGEGALGIKRTPRECELIRERMSKPVIRSDGKIFKSITLAIKETKNTNTSNIGACIRGLRGTCGGYSWKFLNNDPNELREKNRVTAKLSQKRTRFPQRPIKCLTNNKNYDSISEAARQLNLEHSKISSVCSGTRKTHKGYKFIYKENDNESASRV